ncbi:cysteine hydrolase family protein [Brochothrix campestris]|uniref:Isochorismatase-like domain-containing protein n=1 Tax=Brochothrix campestris FSL F6-1037 TaxID=1265861 RepID=W7CZH7_9LIST|nr:isochorismatase family cysteine hydrolase [Brochothrix campestris]EUJ42170.1 hypothetical protein BCAMP_00185 [Brochothrix campestris FSL F6-1037]
MNKALLVIDYTNDFVANDGALTCGQPGQEIEETILNLLETFAVNRDDIIMAVDSHIEHDDYHPEATLFPAHNINGTAGRDLYRSIKNWYEAHRLNATVTWLDKTRYSAFVGTTLDLYLRARNIRELHLVGVCTDICVLHTAVSAYNLGYKLVIHEAGVASFNQTGHQWALNHFKNSLGAEVR